MASQPEYDLVVIGAGINGAGIFREASLRGYKTLLLEKEDLSSATTATSSRLIHGGLRYLEHYEIPLVRESLRERERLLHSAPHLVTPLPLTLPVYHGHKRGPFMIGLGMIAYDLLSYDKSVPNSKMLTDEEALAAEPGLNPEGLRAAGRYYDCQITFPERLVVELVVDGVRHGGTVKTHSQVTGFQIENGHITGVIYTDHEGDEHTVTTASVMNVGGPWIDRVLELAGEFPRYNGGTKGSHIIVEPFPGAPKDALYIEARQDGRPYFIIPWNDLYLIGTTDIRFTDDLERIVATEDEIRYLLDETNLAIPDANLTRESVLYTFSGVRPLPYVPEGSTGAITRKHIIQSHQPQVDNLFTIIGGKLTTFRSLAEEAIDEIDRTCGRPVGGAKSPTRTSRLPGASANMTAEHNRLVANRPDWMTQPQAQWLVNRYGLRAKDVYALAEANERYRQPIHEGHDAIIAVIPFSFEHEYAGTLADVMLRRTMIALDADAGIPLAESMSHICQELYGWSDEHRDAEYNEFIQQISKQLPKSLR
ncbi:MAG: glycerol-3-phosphate dehydrogenase/oxidase [Thermomicrobiales bacterium]|nr:glycerol-3-phosphate dehydrogenase/oxidase [Thermomicrobiales bacterium]MCO5227399.1 glycerol-3-phosphate dehydrogenase/oxidase [Thermomicrobiales bacterium]